MKHMILSLLSVCIKSLCLSATPVLHSVTAGDTANSTVTEFYTSQNKAYVLNDSSTYFIVLRNNQYCSNCFLSINDYVINLKKQFPVKYLAVSICDSGSLERKISCAETRKLLPDFDETLVQYSGSKSNAFAKYSVYSTPEILIVRHTEITHIPYREIFEIAGLNISRQTQNKIVKLLNEK